MKDSRKFWNSQAKNFNSNDDKEAQSLVEQSKKYLKADMAVLDFGCGTGGSTHLISEHVKSILGLDYSDEMIVFAKQKKTIKDNVSFKSGTIDDKELNKGEYDVIVAYNVLHLVDDLDEVLHRMSNLLKAKGVVISSTAVLGEKKNILSLIIKLVSKIGFFPSVKSLNVKKMNKKFIDRGFLIQEGQLTSEKVPNYFLVAKKDVKSKI